MNKFLNIKSEGSMATVFLYGDIGGYDGGITDAQIIRELKDAESVYKRIEVRINSRGGDVYTGIAIFNALAASKSDISIYVDGIAASMASVIALCGKPLFMSKYARLMIHSVSGGCYGTKNEIRDACEQMESLEETLCEMYSKRIGKTSEEIKALYFDGADHYLKASEALELGFVDGIYDADPLPEDSTPEQIYTLLNNRLERPQNNNNMNFLERIKKHRLFNNVASDDDILVEIEKLETGAGKVPVLESRVAELEKELKIFRDKAKADADASVKALLDAAVADGRINEAQRAVYQALLEKDRENGEAALKAIAPRRRVVNHIDGKGGEMAGSWDKRMEEIRNKSKK